ncbi:baeRF2 domain-containing protein [Cellulosimicrobium cellulans]|uniref:baeRF2 domain-containing protein n=1 Tax=Cellulosimicrobium cellulans TaxID=1710 RepID=UPI00084965F3|nr:Vms1/Ankzf1 family peptidyl-tRNA hydrolase [Cellulosimicrobium cellulans]
MKIDWLKPLLGHPGPFATVYLDATRANEVGYREVENRWKGVRRELHQQGAPDTVLDDLEEVVLRPTRVAGPHGRVLIADETGVLVDRVLQDPPPLTQGRWDQVPALLQAARAGDEAVRHVRVAVDRTGADMLWSDDAGYVTGAEAETVQGDHDVINKVSAGGWGQRRVETRAEDSWERNAETVAAELERQVAEHKPEVVLLTGDVRSVPLVRRALGRQVEELVVEVPGGGRAAGIQEAAFEDNVADALDSFRERRREKVLAEFRQEQGRESGAVTSVDDVVTVLTRGQVDELILADTYAQDANPDGRTLWIGPDPMHIAAARADLEALGVSEGIEELPAPIALVRAAIGQDAGVTFAPEGSVELIEGVGATLRWSDEGTPKEVAATMSGDDSRLRGEVI